MTKSNSRNWLMIGVTGAACAACCAPLLGPLAASVFAGAGALTTGWMSGFSAAQIACAVMLGIAASLAIGLILRSRRRAEPACGCTPGAGAPACVIDGPCGPTQPDTTT